MIAIEAWTMDMKIEFIDCEIWRRGCQYERTLTHPHLSENTVTTLE